MAIKFPSTDGSISLFPAVKVTAANLPPGTNLIVRKVGSTWPVRPTTRTDIVVTWVGADPDPGTGTGGAINNVDLRMVV